MCVLEYSYQHPAAVQYLVVAAAAIGTASGGFVDVWHVQPFNRDAAVVALTHLVAAAAYADGVDRNTEFNAAFVEGGAAVVDGCACAGALISSDSTTAMHDVTVTSQRADNRFIASLQEVLRAVDVQRELPRSFAPKAAPSNRTLCKRQVTRQALYNRFSPGRIMFTARSSDKQVESSGDLR